MQRDFFCVEGGRAQRIFVERRFRFAVAGAGFNSFGARESFFGSKNEKGANFFKKFFKSAKKAGDGKNSFFRGKMGKKTAQKKVKKLFLKKITNLLTNFGNATILCALPKREERKRRTKSGKSSVKCSMKTKF
ncbi:MAG: hypothetical protein PHV34_07890 [Verrucomicrobiae bacterium]|nr:hypothetical protein [Verrucomicrobiae bacterium]